MCMQCDSARTVAQAARHLEKVCLDRLPAFTLLQQQWNEIIHEEVPPEWLKLLAELK